MQKGTMPPRLTLRETKTGGARAEPGPMRRIYGREEGCDVAFIASDNWRIPAHSEVLKNANVVFSSMFSEEFFVRAEEGGELPSIEVKDVDGRSLDNLLRCLYGEPVPVQSPDTALSTLYAGHKYRCPELVNLCNSCLSSQLNDTNVLTVLKVIRILAVDYQNLQNVHTEKTAVIASKRRASLRSKCKERSKRFERESASNFRAFNPHHEEALEGSVMEASAPIFSNDLDPIESSCSDLLQKCLQLIDRNALTILESDEFEELDLETLNLIFSRSTLNIRDETKVFNALMRWGDQECKRQQLPLTIGNKRLVLKEAIFLPRYLTMRLKDFQNGPLQSGIFATEEAEIIQGLIAGRLSLSQVATSEAPLFFASKSPRRPLPLPNVTTKSAKSSPRPKRQALSSIFLRIFRIPNGKCCKKSTFNSAASTPFSSNPGSPAGSNPSSPSHPIQRPLPNHPNMNNIGNAPRRGSQTARMNIWEQMIVCFACLFD